MSLCVTRHREQVEATLDALEKEHEYVDKIWRENQAEMQRLEQMKRGLNEERQQLGEYGRVLGMRRKPRWLDETSLSRLRETGKKIGHTAGPVVAQCGPLEMKF